MDVFDFDVMVCEWVEVEKVLFGESLCFIVFVSLLMLFEVLKVLVCDMGCVGGVIVLWGFLFGDFVWFKVFLIEIW